MTKRDWDSHDSYSASLNNLTLRGPLKTVVIRRAHTTRSPPPIVYTAESEVKKAR